ncbi:unnamed protein product [Gongylonema pulchrum]|uniref:Conserved oligomeric Golgi complex subunit 5 n=1 Tax=Gongylonema pulchrum TaxID=637853 RepID=A0A183DSU3_9BILA|nr:unnamed protein product [Gongylonema pulchrum]
MSLEQYSLLSIEIITQFCEQLAKVVSKRIPENAPYASRFVQLLSKTLSIDAAVKEEIEGVEWDAQLKVEMEGNITKVMQLVAQKIEQRLVLDPSILQMGERISSAQMQNYAALSVAHSLSTSWPTHAEPLTRILRQAREAIMDVARSSVFTILASMHNEELSNPSPYAKELCNYLRVFLLHAPLFLNFPGSGEILTTFLDYTVELFLLSSSLIRPLSSDQLNCLSLDLQYIASQGLSLFDVQSSVLRNVPQFAEAFKLPPEQLPDCDALPFWFVVQLLISLSEESLISPHVSAGWSLQEYLRWFLNHSNADRISFMSSLMRSYTSSVIAGGRTEYVTYYPLIMNILQKVVSST